MVMKTFKTFLEESKKFTTTELGRIRKVAKRIAGVEEPSIDAPKEIIPKKTTVQRKKRVLDPKRQLSKLSLDPQKRGVGPTIPIKAGARFVHDEHDRWSKMPHDERLAKAREVVTNSDNKLHLQMALYHGDEKTREAVRQKHPREADIWEKQNPHLFADKKIKPMDLKKKS